MTISEVPVLICPVWSLHTPSKKNFLDMHSPALPYGFDDRRRPFCPKTPSAVSNRKGGVRSAPQQPPHQKKIKKERLWHTSSCPKPIGFNRVPIDKSIRSVQICLSILGLGGQQDSEKNRVIWIGSYDRLIGFLSLSVSPSLSLLCTETARTQWQIIETKVSYVIIMCVDGDGVGPISTILV